MLPFPNSFLLSATCRLVQFYFSEKKKKLVTQAIRYQHHVQHRFMDGAVTSLIVSLNQACLCASGATYTNMYYPWCVHKHYAEHTNRSLSQPFCNATQCNDQNFYSPWWKEPNSEKICWPILYLLSKRKIFTYWHPLFFSVI